ncbi:Txe/YoeB family addiction module toxin [Mammaliicoccus sp. G-M28]|uniref:Txe/YoeB family addiction module toxin n=1 Tax=Mammaliicoccus sp. G-M28 TaxID=2898688 RepID=UPI001EFB4CD2|nr:Txe/YoeB family addiction module toxin [Mammaliicoccus sp. G-M28]
MSKLDITFSPQAFKDYEYFQEKDKQLVKRINQLLKSISRDGVLCGIGKPEKLIGNYSGYYSRRINHEHRLVYTIKDSSILIISCRYHY